MKLSNKNKRNSHIIVYPNIVLKSGIVKRKKQLKQRNEKKRKCIYQKLEKLTEKQKKFENLVSHIVHVQNQFLIQETQIAQRRYEEFAQYLIQYHAWESNRQDEIMFNQLQELKEKILNIEKKTEEVSRFVMYSNFEC